LQSFIIVDHHMGWSDSKLWESRPRWYICLSYNQLSHCSHIWFKKQQIKTMELLWLWSEIIWLRLVIFPCAWSTRVLKDKALSNN